MEDELYKENIMDHYKHPRNAGVMAGATFSRRELNASCGDELEFFVLLDEAGKVSKVSFNGQGCAISQSATSMLTEKVEGMTIDELKKLLPEDVFTMLGVPVDTTRIRCALLGFKALKGGLEVYLQK